MAKKCLVMYLLLMSSVVLAQETKGTVVSQEGPIQGATVQVKNSFTEAVTDADGNFNIKASEGAVLVVSYFGMEPKEVLVPASKTLQITLETDAELLDEVLIEAKRKEQEKTEETAYGKRNRKALGYSTSQVLTADQINQSYTSSFDVLRLLPGIAVSGLFPNQAVVFTKNLSITTALPAVVVDGAVYEQSILNAITPDEIEQVSLLKSANATLRYGQLGAGGAILITTKMAARNNLKEVEKPPSLLVEGNEYEESVITYESLPNTAPYIVALQNATSFDAAKRIYEEQTANGNNNTVSYYASVSDYFLKWDKDFSFRVLSNIAREATNNPRALKTYAYKLEERDEMLKALNVYNRILALRPEQAQSYRDVAKASEAVGDYQTAFALYYQIIYNTIPKVDCTGIKDLAINEMLHLLAFHKNKVPYETLPNDFLATKLNEDIRIVLEWNTPAKDFETQFVSPDNKFFIWNHTKFPNKELLEQEATQGFAIKEQLVDEKSKGMWRVNIRYYDEDPENNPTFLKYTLYQNYGQPNETQEIKVFNLAKLTEKITVDTFLYE